MEGGKARVFSISVPFLILYGQIYSRKLKGALNLFQKRINLHCCIVRTVAGIGQLPNGFHAQFRS